MTFNSLTKSLTLLVLMVSFVSCGGSKPMVDDIKVVPRQVDGDILLSLTADLSIGNVQLPMAAVPIRLKNGKEIGTLTLLTTSDGRNQLSMDVNVSETANLNLASDRLPNGSVIPLIGDSQVITIPVGSKVVVYLSLAENNAALGVSIPIRSFDKIGEKVGTAALMPFFNKNGRVGAAGLYTSKTAGLNGFSLVADISDLINIPSAVELNQIAAQQEVDEELTTREPSSRQEKRINRELLKMHRAKARLRM